MSEVRSEQPAVSLRGRLDPDIGRWPAGRRARGPGGRLPFADGTERPRSPAVPTRERAQHALFVGFPGFVSKLWMAHDQSGRYRGVYQWGDPILAEAYARALWWVLAAVCEPSSIHHVVFPDVDRDALLAAPSLIAPEGLAEVDSWCRIMKVT